MPFRGTDRDAWRKAGKKGKTAEQRSKIYYKEKEKNVRTENVNPDKYSSDFPEHYDHRLSENN